MPWLVMVPVKVMILSVFGFGILALGMICLRLGGLDFDGGTTYNIGGNQDVNVGADSDLIIIYNRVPKTGSTSLTGLAYDLCTRNKFHVLHLNITKNAHVLSLSDQVRLARNISHWRAKHPGFFHGHMAYFDFAQYGTGTGVSPLFINVVRDPIDRMVSYYYFLRYGDDFRPGLVRRRQGDTKPIDDCVQDDGKDCDPSNMWMQVPFFCGHAAACWDPPGNAWALDQAKRNLVERYLLVGLTEEMDTFVLLLETILPSMFRGAHNLYQKGEKSHLRRTYNKTIPLPETMEKLQQSDVYKMEAEFYRFAKEQFEWAVKRTLAEKRGRIADRGQQFFYEKIRPRNPKDQIRKRDKFA